MPAFLAFLIEPATLAVAGFSAWLGSLVENKVTMPAQAVPVSGKLDPIKVGLYVAGGLGLFWLASKSGFLKALK